MIPLYTKEQYEQAKHKDKLPLECIHCHQPFLKEKVQITRALNPNQKKKADYCSHECFLITQRNKKLVKCEHCSKEFYKNPSKIFRVKHNFCSKSCSGHYNQKHKTHGCSRSKLEIWLEQQLTLLYPNLEIHYNKNSAINHELDIYIPKLNVAFELNGIFHYEPIFGTDRLKSAQKNDLSKTKACIDKEIDLCIIDTTGQKYFKEKTSQKYLDIIIQIINQRTA